MCFLELPSIQQEMDFLLLGRHESSFKEGTEPQILSYTFSAYYKLNCKTEEATADS